MSKRVSLNHPLTFAFVPWPTPRLQHAMNKMFEILFNRSRGEDFVIVLSKQNRMKVGGRHVPSLKLVSLIV